MIQENDLILSMLTVRLKNFNTSKVIGTGILYYNHTLKVNVYILTAAHNLYNDGDSFKEPIKKVNIDIFNSATNNYQTLSHLINYDLVSPDINKDVAVLLLNRDEVEAITGTLPVICAIRERSTANTFTLKGFPNATRGEELVCINPEWLQKMTVVEKFQLLLTEDYTSWAIGGFSGSGVFLNANNQLYLYGIFTRFRAEEKGKVIYCQYIDIINEILRENYLPNIFFSFFGEYGLTTTFFKQQIETAIKNLGPRFNEDLNFRLPIARLFNDLAKDNVFKNRFLKAFDNWILARSYGLGSQDNKLIIEIETNFRSLKDEVINWLATISWSSDQKIEMSEITSRIEALNGKIEGKRMELFDLQLEEEKKNLEKKKNYSYHPPYETELNRLREILRNNNDFSNELDNINISLSNHPCLIIQGDAGCGKSHLLGDIANEREKNHQPTLLLLGQLFQNGQNIWQNILSQLNLSCSKEELLISLNSIGQQINNRVVILIDALNEGAGKELWPNELAGFISDLSKYPFVGLALTVRSTYYSIIVPVSVQKNNEISHKTHEGFKGNEYEALRLFCEHYGLQQPNFPILAPEFSNPLFLQLICDGVKNSGLDKFPQGFQGVSNIFGYYMKAISTKLSNKRDEYRLRQNIIQNAIYEMAKACFEQEHTRALPIELAIGLFDSKFQNYRHLLDDLIQENVFIQSISHEYRTGTDIEVIYFSYERLGDFYMAKELLQPYTTAIAVRDAFQKDNELGKLLKDGDWRNRGILEAMAVLLPEKWNMELVEVFDWVFEGDHVNILGNIDEWLNQYLLNSLKWRTIQSIDNKKLTNWFNSDKFNVSEDNYLNSLIELTIQKDHPFNGDRLYRILKQISMSERDSYWQRFILYYSTKDDDNNAYPIRRLIDWAWQPNISEKIDVETARLTGQTLTWILSSTNIALRDQTTKAMVNLLEEQPDALISILNVYKDIDDLYILERLYGITYGCALRTSKNESLLKIAQFVFSAIFKDGNPPRHILLRDYAKNTIEYAIYKELPIEGDLFLIKPPYNSKMPTNIPTEKQLKAYEIDTETPDYKQKYGFYYNQIKFSVMSWDFGRYTVESAFRDFNPVSFTMENEYKVFLKGLHSKQREAIKLFEKISELIVLYEQGRNRFATSIGQNVYDEIVMSMKKNLSFITLKIKTLLNDEEHLFFTKRVIPHLNSKLKLKDKDFDLFDTEPIKRWIVKRAFELGYKAELHGPFDSSIESYNNYSENKIERIGKKYQKIALYEIVAIIADNYKVKADSWSNNNKYIYYPGAWQGYLRDVDPAFITKNNEKDEETDNELVNSFAESKWWIDKQYDYWNTPDSIWVSTLQDLPDPKHIILRKDESGQEWLYLETNIKWEEPKPVGEDKYKIGRKEIWYMIQGFLVRKKDTTKITNWLKQKNFFGRWLPESHDANLSLFNRENYWSQASEENEKEKWSTINDTSYKVMVTSSVAVGEMSQDKSGAHFRYEMPCKLIFEGMKLQYAPIDGEFKNEEGEIVVINPDHRGILIRKDCFMQFLKEKKLEVIWTILGEKNALKGRFDDTGRSILKVINGVYTLENNIIAGSLRLTNRE